MPSFAWLPSPSLGVLAGVVDIVRLPVKLPLRPEHESLCETIEYLGQDRLCEDMKAQRKPDELVVLWLILLLVCIAPCSDVGCQTKKDPGTWLWSIISLDVKGCAWSLIYNPSVIPVLCLKLQLQPQPQ